jgi:hypothetical protein
MFLMLLLSIGCKKDNNSTPTSTDDTTPLPSSMKGYELYSWEENGMWHFTLITGTNRLKIESEIIAPGDNISSDGWVKINTVGINAIKETLGRLSKNENVFWENYASPLFVFPPQQTIDDLKAYCASIGVTLATGGSK